jgi:hypothetical protein
MGLLPTTGGKHPGVGRALKYRPDAIEIAQTLEKLSTLGVRVAGKRKFVKEVARSKVLTNCLELLCEAMTTS